MRAESAGSLTKGVVEAVGSSPSVEVALCPPAVYLPTTADELAVIPVELGGQNLYAAEDGAYTGEVNAALLNDVGCRFVILGHSERRQIMGETDACVSKKLHAALAGNLVPIVCIGERLRSPGTNGQLTTCENVFEYSGGPLGSCHQREPSWNQGGTKVEPRWTTPPAYENVHCDATKRHGVGLYRAAESV